MKRRLSALLCALTLALSLSGCWSGDVSDDSSGDFWEETPPVEADKEKEPEDDYMDDEYRQLMKAHRTVADSAYARLHKLWTIYNKYNDGNITEDKSIDDTQCECHEMYRELDHLRIIDEQMKKKRGKE